jgi:putative transposase
MSFSFSLSDSQWENIANCLPCSRKRKYSCRILFTAMVYVARTGCQWRNLPCFHFPPWQVVYYYFRAWSEKHYLDKAMKQLTRKVRVHNGKKATPSVGIIDAQSIKTAAGVSKVKGWDGAKKLKGRKRHLLTDTSGLPLGVKVGSAGAPDRAGLLNLQSEIQAGTLKVVYADQGYVGIQLLNVPVHIVRQKPKPEGRSAKNPLFQVVPKRWVVERTLGWLTHYRRLNRDYEKNRECATAMIIIALINILTNKMTGKT